MDEPNTAPSIATHSAVHLSHDSDTSTPSAGLSGAQTPIEPSNDDAAATRAATPQRSLPVNDELEQFRSEWKKEVQARGHPTYAQPSSSASKSTQSHHATSSNTQQVQSSQTSNVDSAGQSSSTVRIVPPRKSVDAHSDDKDHLDDQDEDSLRHQDDTSLPFPEAEIYAPAALKYSKGAHKLPRAAAKPAENDLPAPIIPAEYHPPASSSTASPSTSSVANGVSQALRDRIRASATPSSSTSTATASSSRSAPLETHALPNAEASSSSSKPAPPRAPRIMATPHAPALASEATQTGMRSAVEAYAHAVEMERSGQLDQALASYRRAFKLNSNADRLYHRAHLLLTDPALANTSSQQNDALLSSPAIADKVRKALDFDDHRYVAIKERQAKEAEARARGEPIDAANPKASAGTASVEDHAADRASRLPESRPDELAKLLDSLSIEGGGERDFGAVAFEPEDEEKPMPIARLPDEVLLHILRMLIAPRGRRGAKVVKPKPTPEEQAALDAATAALTGRGQGKTNAAKPDAQKSVKANSTAAATAINAAKSDGSAVTAVNGKETAATAPDASATGDRAEEKKSTDGSMATVTRRQPLGIGVVLGGTDWQSLETLGRSCWKFRLLTKSPSLWREIVRETYYPPILDPTLSLATLYERHHSDWRTAFINQPRVRLNGCYIAACHYARPGLSEDAWVRVIHVVEFYRSIRFLPDGTALSLLTTDPPSETVRRLEPGLKAKGFPRADGNSSNRV